MTSTPPNPQNPLEQVLFEVKRTIVGQDVLLERMAIGLLSGGHLLVEGVPGLAKTLAVKSLAAAIGGQFQRIQFTPDLVPADLTGTRVYRQHTGEFDHQRGLSPPTCCCASENTTDPAKGLCGLLEAMQERQVTIGRETFAVPNPFLVMATQNPIESEGTYPLPEAQVDRFMLKVVVHYPSMPEEHAIVERALHPGRGPRSRSWTPEDLVRMQAQGGEGLRRPGRHRVRRAARRRHPRAPARSGSVTSTGTSRTAPARVRPLLYYWADGRWPSCAVATTCSRHDVAELALDVLRHRIVLSYEALADDINPDTVIAGVLQAVRMPEVVLQGHQGQPGLPGHPGLAGQHVPAGR